MSLNLLHRTTCMTRKVLGRTITCCSIVMDSHESDNGNEQYYYGLTWKW